MFLKGLLIGLIFGIPAGAVGALTVQRTLRYGFLYGLLSGMGCSAADTVYACMGAFGIDLISDFILNNQLIINILGSFILIYMGIRLLSKRNTDSNTATESCNMFKMFFSSFAVGITNPAAILTFIFAFSWFGITTNINYKNSILLVLGVFAGTALWWFAIAGAVTVFKSRIDKNIMTKADKWFGIAIIIFGLMVFIKAF
ncbi:MAG: LysE family transporter [Clostridia bacterium]|nr:LysE family transporter [Clostridia bacterium]